MTLEGNVTRIRDTLTKYPIINEGKNSLSCDRLPRVIEYLVLSKKNTYKLLPVPSDYSQSLVLYRDEKNTHVKVKDRNP